MRGKRFFLVGITLMLVLSGLDLLLTYILTPSLDDEANTFVVWYGFGWIELILFSLAVVLFVAIPFYCHCMVFKVPYYEERSPSPLTVLRDYFFRNHKNPVISLVRMLFSILGIFLFFWLSASKLMAVFHNMMVSTGSTYKMFDFEKQMKMLSLIEWIIIVAGMIYFFEQLIWKTQKRKLSDNKSYRFYFLLVPLFFLLFISFKLYVAYGPKVHIVEKDFSFEDQIYFANIEEGDRADIARLLLTIDSCKPAVIGISVNFPKYKSTASDSVLLNALRTIKNDILIFDPYAENDSSKTDTRMLALAAGYGFTSFKRIHGIVSHVTPVFESGDTAIEDFAMKVIKLKEPGFEHSLRPEQTIPIKFRKTTKQFFTFSSYVKFEEIEKDVLKDKIVLVSYAGPGNEDKHFSPFILTGRVPRGEPDMYGLGFIANEIRTIMDYRKKR